MNRIGPEKSYIPETEQDVYPLLHGDIEKNEQSFRKSESQEAKAVRIVDCLKSVFFAILRYAIVSISFLLVMVALAPGLLVQLIRMLSFHSSVVPMKHFPLASELRWEMIPGDTDYWSERIYMGEPSKESEIAWNRLLSVGAFRVTDEEAPGLNLTVGLPLVHGGYGALLGLDHNLHCLRHFRQMYYFDHYWANKTTPEELKWLNEHTIHCLETMRKSMMCNPDLSMHPHFRSGNYFHPINAGAWDNKECVNWESLQETLKPRRFPRSEYGPDIEEAMKTASHRQHGVTHAVSEANP